MPLYDLYEKIITYAIFCSFLYLFNCSSDKKTILNIQGDWISNTNNMHLSFTDSLCTFLYPKNNDHVYKISNNVLTVRDVIRGSQKTFIYSFRIIGLSTDKLQIAIYDNETHNYLHGKITGDTIIFNRPRCQNQINPKLISFFASQCHGPCHSFFIEIDSLLNFKYYGAYGYSSLKGGIGTIHSLDYQNLLEKVHFLDLNYIDSSYIANGTDQQRCYVVIDYNNKKLKCEVYGHDKEPVELGMLFSSIYKLTENLIIRIDSTIDSTRFTHFADYKKLFICEPYRFPDEYKYLELLLNKKH